MTNPSSPQPFTDLARNFVGIGFSPVLFEQMTGGMMRMVEAQFALAQSIAQAQFGLLDAMMRASNFAETTRPAPRPAPRADAHPIAAPHIDIKRPEPVTR